MLWLQDSGKGKLLLVGVELLVGLCSNLLVVNPCSSRVHASVAASLNQWSCDRGSWGSVCVGVGMCPTAWSGACCVGTADGCGGAGGGVDNY